MAFNLMGGVSPKKLMQLKERLEIFNRDHPRVQPFLSAVSGGAVQEGSVMELKVTTPEGKQYVTNIRLNANDIELLRMTGDMK